MEGKVEILTLRWGATLAQSDTLGSLARQLCTIPTMHWPQYSLDV